MKKIVSFAAAGTAGHVEPAIAVARELASSSVAEGIEGVECRFIGTNNGIENALVAATSFKVDHISKVTMPRSISPALISWPFRWCVVLLQTYRILKNSELLVGFGGYVSAPCYVVAKFRRIPIVIHEQNAIPGWGNRLGAYLTHNIAITFDSARQTDKRWRQAKLVGLPLRESIAHLAQLDKVERAVQKEMAAKSFGLDPSKPIMLIFGGSLGAERINQSLSDAITEILAKGIQVIHGVGRSNKLPPSLPGYIPLPYLEDMAAAYAASDLVLARSGAATCVELAAVQNYAVLVPLPIGNGEQQTNAQNLVANGSAEILDNSHLTGEWLVANIDRLAHLAIKKREQREPIAMTNAAKLLSQFIGSILVKASS